jgi:predicted ATP-grasp superfamily ATP-dependent carboligase
VNLLITNVQEEQTYVMLRCLRQEAKKVIVTMTGDSWLQRWSGMCTWSRYVSKRYRVPDCAADWKTGRIQAHNTPLEECYMLRIEEICSAEEIDVIYPSYDSEVYVFAKNRQRLAEKGILAVVPHFEALTRVLDKSMTLEAAEKTGFPVPVSRIPKNLDELAIAAAEIDPPWVLKLRCSAHAKNMVIAGTWDELESAFISAAAEQDQPMIQECIPIETKRNFYMLVNRDLEIVSLFSPKVLRTRGWLNTPCAAVVSTREFPYADEVKALVRELGIYGGITMQTVIDRRDGKPKLMEINPRFGSNLWFRTELGVNEPRALLRMSRGEDPYDRPGYAHEFPEGVTLLDPLWDLRHLAVRSLAQSIGWIRRVLTGKVRSSGVLQPDSVSQLLKDYRSEYWSRTPRITNPLTRGWLSDPLPPLSRVIRVMSQGLFRRG